jgi:enolase-phosphatase E1
MTRPEITNHKSQITNVSAVLLDIEGTTTPIAHVKDVLFPYARAHLSSYLTRNAPSPDLRSLLARLADEHASDVRGGEAVPSWNVVAYVGWLMDRDRKSTALKELQGRIWQEGYQRGTLVSAVFSDVRPALERWTERRIPVGIFSSGSVLAQRLLFRHSSAGDLTPLLRWYFDTAIGPKREPDSYRRIAQTIGCPAGAILFVSDVTAELDAARTAGMQAVLSIRPGNTPVTEGHGFRAVSSLAEIADW